jgi:hypothetical protein
MRTIDLKVRRGHLGPGSEGMLAGDHVVVNRKLPWILRGGFTILHELFHHLMEEDGEIIEFYTASHRAS